MSTAETPSDVWPALPLDAWRETLETLHMWTQVVGKVRLMQSPLVNHWWDVALHPTSRGLTTRPIPHGTRTFEIAFDFLDHRLEIRTDAGGNEAIDLEDRSVASFYGWVMDRLDRLDVPVPIRTNPVEVVEAIPLDEDESHRTYDAAAANRFWRVLAQSVRVLERFRARFVGKSSPVHFFWGSFDLAVTRFSGRAAPEHPGGLPNMPDWATREAYSHEVWSGGFWPGQGLGEPAFYAYAYPEPPGFADARIRPDEGRYAEDLGEFVLPYDAIRTADDPDARLLEFMQTTYEAAADRGRWDRGALERGPARLGRLARRVALGAGA